MSVVVLAPGWATTLQDAGRVGYAAFGIGRAGPMDPVAHRLANALAGNDADAPALEFMLRGPRLRFEAAARVALAGAAFDATLDGRPVPMWTPLRIAAGSVLDVGPTRRGSRGSLALGGGFACPRVLGSAATDLNAALGPFGGRALREGDRLAGGDAGGADGTVPRWSLDPRPWFDPDVRSPLHLVRGAHFDALDAASRTRLYEAEFRIASASNRTGYRLQGVTLACAHPLETVSEPVAAGTLQLPPGGDPIALMAEHPTCGGYPRIGQVAAADLPRLAQRRPGEPVRFREIGMDEAQTRYLRRERELARLVEAIARRLHA
jgi:antagonist of KipI